MNELLLAIFGVVSAIIVVCATNKYIKKWARKERPTHEIIPEYKPEKREARAVLEGPETEPNISTVHGPIINPLKDSYRGTGHNQISSIPKITQTDGGLSVIAFRLSSSLRPDEISPDLWETWADKSAKYIYCGRVALPRLKKEYLGNLETQFIMWDAEGKTPATNWIKFHITEQLKRHRNELS